jgi:hypothetical protein
MFRFEARCNYFLPDFFGNERGVDDDHVKAAEVLSRYVLRLVEIVEDVPRVLVEFLVELNASNSLEGVSHQSISIDL